MNPEIMKNKKFFLVFLIAIILFVPSQMKNSFVKAKLNDKYSTISVYEAYYLVNTTLDLFILDVRLSSEYENGHIVGAYLIPHTKIIDRQDELPTNKSQPILVYCKSGSRSADANDTLVSLSYSNIYNMEGGFDAWKAAGYPAETGPFTKPTTDNTSETSSDSQITSSSSTPLSTSSLEVIIAILAIGLIYIRIKKRK